MILAFQPWEEVHTDTQMVTGTCVGKVKVSTYES